MNKKAKISLMIFALLSVILTGCTTVSQNTPAGKNTNQVVAPINIGAILPLTGDLAPYGEDIKRAVEMAIEKNGGSEKIKLTAEDDNSCIPAKDISTAQKLIAINKVEGLVGPICTGATLAVAAIAEKNQTILISPVATGKSITTAGDYIFRTIASDADKCVAVAKYAFDNGYRKAALLFDVTQDATVLQRDDVRTAFENAGGKIVISESLTSKDKDIRTQLAKIKNSDADVIFVGAVPETVGLILKQARELKIEKQFIATDTSGGSKQVIDTASGSAEGLIFPFATTPTNQESISFINDFKNKYGKEPAIYAAEGYDAATLLIRSLTNAKNRSDARNKLFEIGNNYAGASGVITFDKNGDVQKPMVIKQIKNGEAVEVN